MSPDVAKSLAESARTMIEHRLRPRIAADASVLWAIYSRGRCPSNMVGDLADAIGQTTTLLETLKKLLNEVEFEKAP